MSIRHLHLIILLLSCTLLGACARVETNRTTQIDNEKNFKEVKTELTATQKSLLETQEDMRNRQILEEKFAGGFKVGKNPDGSSKTEADRRSEFENNSYKESGSEFINKNFKTKAFEEKSFAGTDRQFDTSSWKKGDSLADIKLDTPEFAKKQSGIREESNEFSRKKYANTGGNASESGKSWNHLNDIEQPEHLLNQDAIDKRDRIAKPHIMTTKEVQLKTVQEVRSMLGRDD